MTTGSAFSLFLIVCNILNSGCSTDQKSAVHRRHAMGLYYNYFTQKTDPTEADKTVNNYTTFSWVYDRTAYVTTVPEVSTEDPFQAQKLKSNSKDCLASDVQEMKNSIIKIGKLVQRTLEKLANHTEKKVPKLVIRPDKFPDQKTTVTIAMVGKRVYYAYKSPKLNFKDALKWCADRGLQLVSIESKEENFAIEQAVFAGLEDDDKMFWTSGTDEEHLFSFVWKSTGQPFGYTRFNPPDPDNLYNSERCVTIGRNLEGLVRWYDQPCSELKKFICEKV